MNVKVNANANVNVNVNVRAREHEHDRQSERERENASKLQETYNFIYGWCDVLCGKSMFGTGNGATGVLHKILRIYLTLIKYQLVPQCFGSTRCN